MPPLLIRLIKKRKALSYRFQNCWYAPPRPLLLLSATRTIKKFLLLWIPGSLITRVSIDSPHSIPFFMHMPSHTHALSPIVCKWRNEKFDPPAIFGNTLDQRDHRTSGQTCRLVWYPRFFTKVSSVPFGPSWSFNRWKNGMRDGETEHSTFLITG